MEPLKFSPTYVHPIWAGDAIAKARGLPTDTEHNYGEAFDVSAHPDVCVTIANGPLAGMHLDDAISAHHDDIIGTLPDHDVIQITFWMLAKRSPSRCTLTRSKHSASMATTRRRNRGTSSTLNRGRRSSVAARQPIWMRCGLFVSNVIDIDKDYETEPDGVYHIITCVQGSCTVESPEGAVGLACTEPALVPASAGRYTVRGTCRVLQSYHPR